MVAKTVEAFGRLDGLVNNAGNVRAGRLEEVREEEVMVQVSLNLTAPVLLTRAALPALRTSVEGLVVSYSLRFDPPRHELRLSDLDPATTTSQHPEALNRR